MSDKLHIPPGMVMESTKAYAHSVGLSCSFRQWRANDTHCKFLHGYALKVSLKFSAMNLDDRNWVVNFGGLKPVKAWLERTLDHMTVIAKDDPHLAYFEEGNKLGVLQLHVVDHVGCEAFAKMIYEGVREWMAEQVAEDPTFKRVTLQSVEVAEHEANSAIYRRLNT